MPRWRILARHGGVPYRPFQTPFPPDEPEPQHGQPHRGPRRFQHVIREPIAPRRAEIPLRTRRTPPASRRRVPGRRRRASSPAARTGGDTTRPRRRPRPGQPILPGPASLPDPVREACAGVNTMSCQRRDQHNHGCDDSQGSLHRQQRAGADRQFSRGDRVVAEPPARPWSPRRWRSRWPGRRWTHQSSSASRPRECHSQYQTTSEAARFTPRAAAKAQPSLPAATRPSSRRQRRPGRSPPTPKAALPTGRGRTPPSVPAARRGCPTRRSNATPRDQRLPGFLGGERAPRRQPPGRRRDEHGVRGPAEHQGPIAPLGVIGPQARAPCRPASRPRPCRPVPLPAAAIAGPTATARIDDRGHGQHQGDPAPRRTGANGPRLPCGGQQSNAPPGRATIRIALAQHAHAKLDVHSAREVCPREALPARHRPSVGPPARRSPRPPP